MGLNICAGSQPHVSSLILKHANCNLNDPVLPVHATIITNIGLRRTYDDRSNDLEFNYKEGLDDIIIRRGCWKILELLPNISLIKNQIKNLSPNVDTIFFFACKWSLYFLLGGCFCFISSGHYVFAWFF